MSASALTPLSSDPSKSHRSTVQFWPVLLWLALQMMALLAAGFRVPFSARFTVPEEQLAIHEMYCVQMIAAALLFPFLFRNIATTVMILVTTPLMAQLAGVLAAMSKTWPLVGACAYPTLWLLGLSTWAYVLRGNKARLYGVAVASLWVLGGAILAYLIREFGTQQQGFDWAHPALGPLVGGMALLEAGPGTETIWAGLGIFLFATLFAAAWRWRRDRA